MSKKKKGRPRGSKNKTRTKSIVTRQGCKHCGSSKKPKVEGNKIERKISGVLADSGFVYQKVIWRRCRCRDCGGYLSQIEYIA